MAVLTCSTIEGMTTGSGNPKSVPRTPGTAPVVAPPARHSQEEELRTQAGEAATSTALTLRLPAAPTNSIVKERQVEDGCCVADVWRAIAERPREIWRWGKDLQPGAVTLFQGLS